MKSQTYRHVTAHNGSFTWQLSILGHPCRTSAHFETPEEAGVSADLVKHYLRSEFKLDLALSLDGEQFSSLAYSRRHVDLSNSHSVLKSIPEDVQEFLTKHRADLIAHREAAPPETIASKFRRSGMIEIPAVREWVEKLESAELRRVAFSDINHVYFFSLLSALSSRLSDALGPLRRATKMHERATDALLVARAAKLVELLSNLSATAEYVTALAAELREEQAAVESAVATLESARPSTV